MVTLSLCLPVPPDSPLSLTHTHTELDAVLLLPQTHTHALYCSRSHTTIRVAHQMSWMRCISCWQHKSSRYLSCRYGDMRDPVTISKEVYEFSHVKRSALIQTTSSTPSNSLASHGILEHRQRPSLWSGLVSLHLQRRSACFQSITGHPEELHHGSITALFL